MTKDNDHWSIEPHCRTLEGLVKGQFSVHLDPIFSIPLDCIVIDELHLLLRIMDVLLRAVVLECHELDLKVLNIYCK